MRYVGGSILSKMNGFDGRLRAIEDKQLKLSDAIKELNDMVKKLSKESFTIKGTPCEVRNSIKLIFFHLSYIVILYTRSHFCYRHN